MAINLILNITVDEDTQVSVEHAHAGEWQWLPWFLSEGIVGVDSKDELYEALDEWLKGARNDWDDADYQAALTKAVVDFKAKFEELIHHPTIDMLDMGWITLQYVNWAVEVDNCFGLLICLNDEAEKETE